MPYAWVDRYNPAEQWVGQAGDCTRLGLQSNELPEHDAVEFLSLDEAVRRGEATISQDGSTIVLGGGFEEMMEQHGLKPADRGQKKVPKAPKPHDHSKDEAESIKIAKQILKKAGL